MYRRRTDVGLPLQRGCRICHVSSRRESRVRKSTSGGSGFGNTVQELQPSAPGAEIGFGEIPYQEKQVMYLCADISDLEKDTGFAPRVTFAEGIEKTVDWCRKNYV